MLQCESFGIGSHWWQEVSLARAAVSSLRVFHDMSFSMTPSSHGGTGRRVSAVLRANAKAASEYRLQLSLSLASQVVCG